MDKKIALMPLVLLIVASIDNMRNLPAAALCGTPLIFFFVLSAVIFLLPTALVTAELSSGYPNQGGVYQWVHRAFGKHIAMAAIWLQWINTLVWYPTMLSFIAGTFAYMIDPALAENRTYLISFVLCTYWVLTWINLKGIHVSASVNNLCAIAGTAVPLLALIGFGLVKIFSGHPLQIDLHPSQWIPSFGQTTSWVSLIAIMAGFLGMELSGVHVNDVRNPKKNFPRAVLLATLFIFLSMMLSSLAIAVVLPKEDIQLISGIMQVFSYCFASSGFKELTSVVTLLIVLGSIGTMINWLISPAKGLLHAAEFGFLPAFFAQKNKAGVAHRLLLAQASIVTLLCLVLLLEPNVNAFYWFFTAMSTELYMLMYLLLFCAAIKLHYKDTERLGAFKIPCGKWGIWSVCLVGAAGCLLTVFVSFLPPDNVAIADRGRYLLQICAGNVLLLSPLLFFYHYQSRSSRLTITQD